MDQKTELIRLLKGCGALKFGKFVLTSGKESNYYVDIKLAVTKPEILSKIAEMMAVHVENEKLIAGMELGAVPLATAVSLKTNKPFLIIRKGERTHGTMKQIEGEFKPGDEVVLVEDVCTTAGSVLKSIDILRNSGCVVNKAIVVVDREEGGGEAVAAKNVKLLSLLKARELKEG
ncbi:MAG: orotate phosphoribosyltransferase [Thermoplasmata archaeon]|nr:orotate phosphoribosyltransferase [Thermoplasmata archaeon]